MLESGVNTSEIGLISDKIGEKVEISACPSCNYYEDCFANVSGRCTALIAADSPCPFYKSAAVNRAEIQRSITRLKHIGRYDLIFKYALALAMLGALDEEIEEMRRAGAWLDGYQKSNLAGLMWQVMADNLSALDGSDEPDEPDEEGEDEHEV